jgi:hypothetical protein
MVKPLTIIFIILALDIASGYVFLRKYQGGIAN